MDFLQSDDVSTHVSGAEKAGVKHDFNSNGEVDVSDCPFPPGSSDAKAWWADNVDAKLQDNVTPEMKAKYGDSCTGAFNGRPLVPGVRGQDQGDAEYLIVKAQVCEGVSPVSAAKIASKVVSA